MILNLAISSELEAPRNGTLAYWLLERRGVLIERRSVHSGFEVRVGLRRRLEGLKRLAGGDLSFVGLIRVSPLVTVVVMCWAGNMASSTPTRLSHH